jgi:hypothetical protein
MRKGFNSSRGAIRGTIDGAPVGRVGTGGFATVAISFGPFLCSCLNLPACCRAVLLIVQKTQALAANFRGSSMNLLRHSSEQKKTGSPPLRSAIASPSARCIPHTGSRTSFRDTASLGTSIGCCLPVEAAPMLFTSLRSRETLHDTIKTQKRNRKIRAINVIGFADAALGIPHNWPFSSVEPSVCRPLRGVKQKAVDSRSCVARRTRESTIP